MSSRLWVASLILLAAILIPFFLWENQILAVVEGARQSRSHWLTSAVVVMILLALDIVLPVPSSLVSTAAGALLGFVPGLAASCLGMTAGSIAGYLLGRRSASTWLPDADRARLEAARALYGDWIVILCRPVPVLAEASCVFAGASALPFRHFAWLAGAANLGISAVYAAAGAFAAGRESFLLAFAAAIVIPGLAMLLSRSAATLGRNS